MGGAKSYCDQEYSKYVEQSIKRPYYTEYNNMETLFRSQVAQHNTAMTNMGYPGNRYTIPSGGTANQIYNNVISRRQKKKATSKGKGYNSQGKVKAAHSQKVATKSQPVGKPCDQFWKGAWILEKINDKYCSPLNGIFLATISQGSSNLIRKFTRKTGKSKCSVGDNLGWSCSVKKDGSQQFDIMGGAFGAWFILDPSGKKACGRDRWNGQKFCITRSN